MTAYIRMRDLRGHSDTINCLAFSPDARYLASGADDHNIIIWNVTNGAVMYRLVFNSPVHCLLWHPLRTEVIICGLEDGTIYEAAKFSPVSLNSNVNIIHERCMQAGPSGRDINIGVKGQIQCIAYDSHNHYLAVGSGEEVYLTKEINDGNSFAFYNFFLENHVTLSLFKCHQNTASCQ
jgi:WD40 repeat protein